MSSENEKSTVTNQPITKYLSRVKLPAEVFKKIATQLLGTIKIDKRTAKIIKEQVIDAGNYGYISLIRKYAEFLTPIRLMILVDFVDILKAFKYYLNDFNSNKYDKNLTKDYSFISGLQAAELKLIMLEQLYEIFDSSSNLGVIFHEPQEKVDAIIEIDKSVKINLTDNEGLKYIYTINPGKYVFESRSCCSISDSNYILNNEKRLEYCKNFDRYFLFVPKDTTIYDEAARELERNNIKTILSDYSTIDIVNDVAYMEGILAKGEDK